MNAAGQALLEFVLLTFLFLLLIASVIRYVPNTFSESTPYLGARVQDRLETGGGYARERGGWQLPASTKGGMKD